MAYDAYDDGRRDFHFLYGRWSVEHRRLKARGVGADDWEVFHGSTFCQGLMGGLCNVDENDFPDRGFQGLSFRSFNVEERQWSIYWVNSQQGVLQAPVHGRGVFGDFAGHIRIPVPVGTHPGAETNKRRRHLVARPKKTLIFASDLLVDVGQKA